MHEQGEPVRNEERRDDLEGSSSSGEVADCAFNRTTSTESDRSGFEHTATRYNSALVSHTKRPALLERHPPPRLGLALRAPMDSFVETLVGFRKLQGHARHLDLAVWAGYDPDRPLRLIFHA
jgi:hypothetical protein